MLSYSNLMVNIEREDKNPLEDPTYKELENLFKISLKELKTGTKINIYELREQFIKPLVQFIGENRLNVNLDALKEVALNTSNQIDKVEVENIYLEHNLLSVKEELHKWEKNLCKILEKF